MGTLWDNNGDIVGTAWDIQPTRWKILSENGGYPNHGQSMEFLSTLFSKKLMCMQPPKR